MAEFLQFIITGISVGMVYALIALGFVLIWKSSSVANLALGQLVLLSSWFTYSMLVQAKLPVWLGFPAGDPLRPVPGLGHRAVRPAPAHRPADPVADYGDAGHRLFHRRRGHLHLALERRCSAPPFPPERHPHRAGGDFAGIRLGDRYLPGGVRPA